METSEKMQEIITGLAKRHNVALAEVGAHLRLDMPGYDRLMIRRFETNLVSVSHYYESHGDLVPDPQIIFFVGYGEWVPIEITQVIGGTRRCAGLTPDGEDIAWFHLESQADLADFAEMWADNIKAQGWLEDGQKWESSSEPSPL